MFINVTIFLKMSSKISIHQSCSHYPHDQEEHSSLAGGGHVAGVLAAVTLLPVHTIVQDTPVTHSGHTSVRHTGASTDHLPPPSIPYEASWSLLDYLDTECARSVTLITVTLHRCVSLFLKRPVHSTIVLKPVL